MIETSRSRAPATYASTSATSSNRKARSSAPARSSGVWARVIPTELPSPDGLIISRASPVPSAKAASSVRTASRATAQRAARTSRHSATGNPMPRVIRLNRALSMPSADAATPDPVYARPAASSMAWTVPSSPNGPWRAMNTTGAGRQSGQPVQRRAGGDRSVRPEPDRIVVGSGRAVRPPMVRRQPPPPALEIDEHLLDVVTGVRERLGDGRPGHDRDVVLGRGPAEQDDDPAVAG